MPTLTPEGRKWAESRASVSIVARVALAGSNWPSEFIVTAIKACNKAALEEL
jgi:hypothetical protein